MPQLLQAIGLVKAYRGGRGALSVLHGIELAVEQGEFVAVRGASGSGKSTLLNILGCLDRPDAGRYRFAGRDVLAMGEIERAALRASAIGFVFQMFHLLSDLDVAENVELPFHYGLQPPSDVAQRVAAALDGVGLLPRRHHRPAELSGGEMQRAAIARAIVTRPRLILADEPTGNLDSTTGSEILDLFQRLNRGGTTLVMVTHDTQVACRAHRVLTLRDGRFEAAG